MEITKENLYSRQRILPEIGDAGQEALLRSRVAIVGCGGLGGLVAVQLAASGLGCIHLIDYDLVSVSNLHRQYFYRLTDTGRNKSEILASYILGISPFVSVTHSTKPVTRETISSELNEFDLIVDCTDSLITKYLLNDFCVLNDKILVYGSLYKHDGYVSSFNLPTGGGRSANLRDAFMNLPDKSIPNCSEVGTLNPIVGLIATLQTNEVIKIISGSGHPLINRILIYNSMHNSQFVMSIANRVTKDEIRTLFEGESYYEARCADQDEELLITSAELKERLAEVEILSVIEETDLDLPFRTQYREPYSRLRIEDLKLPSGKDLVVVCKKGISSYEVTRKIKSLHSECRVFSLSGGIENY